MAPNAQHGDKIKMNQKWPTCSHSEHNPCLLKVPMVGRDQYGYKKGPYYMVKQGPMPPGEHNKVESKKLHKLGRFPNLRAAMRDAGNAFS